MSREATAREAKRKQELLRERKKAEAELVKQGKKPYFLKRCRCHTKKPKRLRAHELIMYLLCCSRKAEIVTYG